MVTVRIIKELILGLDTLQIFIYDTSDLYEFPNCEIPEELLDMKINSIDNPTLNTIPTPMCLNLEIEDNFDDYEAFKEEFKEFLIK